MTRDMYDLDVVDRWLELLGEQILMRYSHPDEWEDDTTPGTKHRKVLRVWEIRTFDTSNPLAARTDLCAAAIEAWLRSKRATVFTLHRPTAQTGLITVHAADWGMALYYLRPLDRMRRERDALPRAARA
jgi:hypothetical protein